MLTQLTKNVKKGQVRVKIKTTHGDMSFKLFEKDIPKAVENFLTHAKNGYYNGVIFHRVIKDFMIQGGDPTGTGMGGESIWGHSFEDEFSMDYFHFYGALSMANAGPSTNGSQFFIVTKEAPHLDGQYAAFGKVTKGLDVVHEIEKVSVGANDKPVEDVVIESIKVDTKGIEYKEPEKVK